MAQITEMERINMALANPAAATMTIEEIVAEEIREFKNSPAYGHMLQGEQYYQNRSDVQQKRNEVANRSNTKIEHPLIKKLVDQKANYLLSKPFAVKTEAPAYAQALNQLFNAGFRRKMKSSAKAAVKHGIAWIQPYFNGAELEFMRIPATEIVPIWEDAEKTSLGGFIRFYEQTVYVGNQKGRRMLAEYWTCDGVQRFTGKTVLGTAALGRLQFELDKSYGTQQNNYTESHFVLNGKPFNFAQVPIAWVRYNEEELPLAYFIKELVDDLNWQTSVTADVLRDIAKFIYVLRNYGGSDLAEFTRELQEHLAIKVDGDGGVDKLQADLNIDAVMQFLDKNRRDAIYFADGVDTQDADLGNASGSAINFRYMDLDNDCQALAAEMQEMFTRLKLFIDVYLQVMGLGDFTAEPFEIVFNMDMPVNETDVINNVRNSEGIISKKTQIENHPWVKDADEELARIEQENTESMEKFGTNLFANTITPGAESAPAGEGGEQDTGEV